MSKRVLAILVVTLLAIGFFGAVAQAGVEGDFTFDIWMWPQTTTYEAYKFDIDFEALLNLDVTLSGLTFSNDLAMGITGIEHYIADISTTLGALDLKDEFAFAKPYLDCPWYKPSAAKYIDMWFGGGAGFPAASTTCHAIGGVLFVKKRVNMEISIGGLTASTLVMFEDVNFPEPTWHGTHLVPVPPSPGATYNNIYPYDEEDQEFRFGTIFGIRGTTISGIGVTAKTGICADWTIRPAIYFTPDFKWGDLKLLETARNRIKKYSWSQTVCTNEKLEFTKEYIAITNISPISGLVINNHLLFAPSFAFFNATEIDYTLPMNLGSVYVWFDAYSPKYIYLEPGLPLGNPLVMLNLGQNLLFIWQDVNRTFSMDEGDLVTAWLEMSIQNATFTTIVSSIVSHGLNAMLTEVEIPISYPEPIGSLSITGLWLDIGGGVLAWEYVDFALTKNIGEHNTFHVDAMFSEDGLLGVNMSIGVNFAL